MSASAPDPASSARSKPTLRRRASGALLHVTSLPGGHGVGDLGPAARRFADFLSAAGQSWWQMLPVGPAGAGNSPYSSPSSFAGFELLVSLEDLVEDGLLEAPDVEGGPASSERADYEAARAFKDRRLRKAFAKFSSDGNNAHWDEFRTFYARHSAWLDDYAMYRALRELRPESGWLDWPEELRSRAFRKWDRETLRKAGEAATYHHFTQYLFDRQWRRLRAHAAARGVGLIGDVPIFVALESSDVWAAQDNFRLGSDGRPEIVTGVPPDYFSEDGQLWGNPHYRWDALKARDYDWWLSRLRCAAERFDAVRLDHFIGFARAWEIPAGSKTAKEGRWGPGPGADFFEAVSREHESLELIAEDLGSVTEEITSLRDRFDLPGMRVLQFAFGADQQAESFLPHNYPRRCVAYTGTHDNDTTVGWFSDDGAAPGARSREQIERERWNALRYLKSDGKEIHWDMIRAILKSTADTAIVPVQDLLGLGAQARMNRPGTVKGNWEWRLLPEQLTDELGARLLSLTRAGGRLS